jgi:hypothetical protein
MSDEITSHTTKLQNAAAKSLVIPEEKETKDSLSQLHVNYV